MEPARNSLVSLFVPIHASAVFVLPARLLLRIAAPEPGRRGVFWVIYG